MQVFPLLSNLDRIFLPSCMATTAISPKVLLYFIYFAFFPENRVCGGFALSGLTIILSNLVAVEMTSHQSSPLPFESMPAWISMALALPINVGILLSATEFC